MSLGFPEMLFLFIVALIIFGPRKLPEIGRQVGKALSEFRRASNEFKSQLETEMRQIELEEDTRRHIAPDSEAEPCPVSPQGTIATSAAYAAAGESTDAGAAEAANKPQDA